MERGIADNASIAAKAQLEVARARLEAAVSKLQSVNSELERLHMLHSWRLGSPSWSSYGKRARYINWEKELKEAEEDLERLNQKILSAKDHKAKLDTASFLLQVINNDLAAYMESKLKQEDDDNENSKGELL
ncbi:hypothetical protein CQW23_03806 [Capsicum baccatum]|uniref:Uncharacterized protein n=1 Tax=Capsicum baccatum TaxID=33114 RepID=A0A2G2XCW6_CAPBA|nr:hypothetical protein CQW23_03806 [Capsicum baccatum]